MLKSQIESLLEEFKTFKINSLSSGIEKTYLKSDAEWPAKVQTI